MRRAIFAASLDPITNGHLWVIKEAEKLFDEVIVGVGVNPSKKYTFEEDDRFSMAYILCANEKCEVRRMGMKYLVDFAKEHDAQYIVRGVRNGSDFAYEHTLKNVNARMAPEITTVFLVPPTDLAEVSSSFVKGLVGYEGWQKEIRRYVPEHVATAMMARFQFLEKETK